MTMAETVDCTSACGGSHIFIWGGDPEGWPYDGMPCACGTVRFDKAKNLEERIAELQRELEAVKLERDAATSEHNPAAWADIDPLLNGHLNRFDGLYCDLAHKGETGGDAG